MPQYQVGQVYFGSGLQSAAVMVPLERVNNVRITPSIQRTSVPVLNRGKPLELRPVIQYSPVEASFEFVKSNKRVEEILALISASNITANIVETKVSTVTYGVRDAKVMFSPTNSLNFNGEIDLTSGVLNNFSYQGSVGEAVKASFSMQFLDMVEKIGTGVRNTTNYEAGLIKPAGIILTGIQFSGFGVTGMKVQSFSLGINFNRTPIMELGEKYPTERPFTDVSASIQVQGYIDGFNNTMSGLSIYDKGDPMYGQIGLTLYPADSSSAPTFITMKNPYLATKEFSAQVGGFTTASFGFELPIGPNPNEITDGSVLTIT